MTGFFKHLSFLPILAVLPLASHAMEDQNGSTQFKFTARFQAELVHADGSAANARERDGWHITDAWGGGRPNSHNWGAIFADIEHRFADGTQVFARYGLSVDTDGLPSGPSKDREIYVGARGAWGQVRAGRLETPYKLNMLAWDPLNATFMQARANLGRSGGALGHGGYWDDSIDYTYRINRLTLHAFMSKNDGLPSTVSKKNTFSVGVNYQATEALELAFAHVDSGYALHGSRSGSKVGIRYSAGPWIFASEYETRKRGLEHADIVFATATYRAAKFRYSLSLGGFLDESEAGNDGEYIAFGVDTQLNPQLRLHGGIRYNNRDRIGSETLVGVGLRYTFQSQRRM